jgi:hypothetical protein
MVHVNRSLGSDFDGWSPKLPNEMLRLRLTVDPEAIDVDSGRCLEALEQIGPLERKPNTGRLVVELGVPVPGWTDSFTPEAEGQLIAELLRPVLMKALGSLDQDGRPGAPPRAEPHTNP